MILEQAKTYEAVETSSKPQLEEQPSKEIGSYLGFKRLWQRQAEYTHKIPGRSSIFAKRALPKLIRIATMILAGSFENFKLADYVGDDSKLEAIPLLCNKNRE